MEGQGKREGRCRAGKLSSTMLKKSPARSGRPRGRRPRFTPFHESLSASARTSLAALIFVNFRFHGDVRPRTIKKEVVRGGDVGVLDPAQSLYMKFRRVALIPDPGSEEKVDLDPKMRRFNLRCGAEEAQPTSQRKESGSNINPTRSAGPTFISRRP